MKINNLLVHRYKMLIVFGGILCKFWQSIPTILRILLYSNGDINKNYNNYNNKIIILMIIIMNINVIVLL